MTTPEQIPDVFGANIRALRKSSGITLDQFAQQARRYGAKWSSQRVAHIESGRIAVTVQNLCVAAWTLSALMGETVTPARLVASESDVEVHPGLVVDGDAIPRALAGERLKAGDVSEMSERAAEAFERHNRESEDFYRGFLGYVPELEVRREASDAGILSDSGWDDIPEFSVVMSEREMIGLADWRMASRLGVPEMELLGLSFKLWGHGLASEVAKRASERATPQKRGHVTRQLEAEIREEMRNRGDD